MASAPTEVLASFVERVTFHSEEKGSACCGSKHAVRAT